MREIKINIAALEPDGITHIFFLEKSGQVNPDLELSIPGKFRLKVNLDDLHAALETIMDFRRHLQESREEG